MMPASCPPSRPPASAGAPRPPLPELCSSPGDPLPQTPPTPAAPRQPPCRRAGPVLAMRSPREYQGGAPSCLPARAQPTPNAPAAERHGQYSWNLRASASRYTNEPSGCACGAGRGNRVTGAGNAGHGAHAAVSIHPDPGLGAQVRADPRRPWRRWLARESRDEHEGQCRRAPQQPAQRLGLAPAPSRHASGGGAAGGSDRRGGVGAGGELSGGVGPWIIVCGRVRSPGGSSRCVAAPRGVPQELAGA